MQRLLQRQIRASGLPDPGADTALAAFIELVHATYADFDRERLRNDRAAMLMDEELRAAHARLARDSDDTISTLIKGVTDGILLTDTDRRITLANTAARAMFDLTPEIESDLAVTDLIDLALDGTTIEETTGLPKRLESQSRSLAGRTFHVEYSESLYSIGARKGSLWIIRDTTARRAREKALADAREAAEVANRMKSQFLSTMSHELRTPLNAILGFAELLGNMPPQIDAPETRAEYAGYIHQSGLHLLSLINDLLDLSKIEAGAYTLSLEPVLLSPVIGHTAGMVRGLADKKGIAFDIAPPPDDATIHGDERAIGQILMNILGNAIKFTPPGGAVRLTCAVSGDCWELAVRDTGIGIAEKDMAQIAQPFFQADPSEARQFEGSGLGLAITKRLVERHGGRLEIESRLGAGTCVRVLLPQAAGEQSSDSRRQSEAAHR